MRVVEQLQSNARFTHARGPKLYALTSSAQRIDVLRMHGVLPLYGNLDDLPSLERLRGVAQHVIHLAPPKSAGQVDMRSVHLIRVLRKGSRPRSMVYGSTTGVYGNCDGAWIDETRTTHPATDRARRRVHAEQSVRSFGLQSGVAVKVLRIPGIYAPDREGGTPRGRLLKGLPVLRAQEDVFTNHIHADDLAQIVIAAMWGGRAQRVYNACDFTEMRMGDYFDWAADWYGLPRPARISRAQAQQCLPPLTLSFLGESRRLRNTRIVQELGVRLRYPTVREGLKEAGAST